MTTTTSPHIDPRLVRYFISHLVRTAELGWTPADLIHVFGTDIETLVCLAAPQVPTSQASAPIKQAWLAFQPSPHAKKRSLRFSAASDFGHRFGLTSSRLSDWFDLLYTLCPLCDDTRYNTGATENMDPQVRKIQRKIDSLLAKAESTQFADEAETLIAKAQQLRQNYRIAQALHDTCGQSSKDGVISLRIYIDGPWVKPQYVLLSHITQANSAACILLSSHGIASVIGQREDVEHIKDLYVSLNRQRAWYMNNSAGAKEAAARKQTAAYRRSFMLAYAYRIGDLLEAANQDALRHASTARTNDAGTSADGIAVRSALPALQQRQAEAQAVLSELFPECGNLQFSITNGQGAADGITAADRSHLNGDASGIHMGKRQLAS